jgi:NACHT domain
MVWVADDMAAWLVEQLADAGRRKLTELILGDEFERALRQAATAAVRATADELSPGDEDRAERLAMVISEVFAAPVPDTSGACATVLDALQAGIAAQMAILEDREVTGTGQSSTDVEDVPAGALAQLLTRHLLAGIVFQGARGGPLSPLAVQINMDVMLLQGQQTHDIVRQLGTELLEAIAKIGPPAALAPDSAAAFADERARYLARLQDRYRRVDLEVLTPLTEQNEQPQILLGSVFVPQLVRADPPPLELPRELWRRLTEAGEADEADLPEGLDRETLERARRTYQERPMKPVPEAISEPGAGRVVLLGDPGAGKSTLGRYLMLALAIQDSSGYGPADPAIPAGPALAGALPLLVELRTFASLRWRDHTFLDLIDHLHRTENLGMPRPVLEPYLRQGGRALIVFDGLDEIFDPAVREQVTRQIEAFAGRYPQVRVIVTSRVVGYRRAMLDAAGFTHWMLQDLDAVQVRSFTSAWYAASCPDDPAEGARLRDRLLRAVEDSAAVGELAGNPMLLTILAIIGRRQELPRERRLVYEHAVMVLIEHWDATGKHLHDARVDDGMPYLSSEDKLELLRLVARRMQAG